MIEKWQCRWMYSLGVNSSVKFRGLRVGRVVSLDTERDAEGLYAAKIVVDEEFAEEIPGDVVARVLPGTLFGAEYLELRTPGTTLRASGGGSSLEDGIELAADTSSETVRLMNTFSAMYRVIDSIDHVTPSGFVAEGDEIALLGFEGFELGGSELLSLRAGKVVGDAPALDIQKEASLQRALLEAIRSGLVAST